MWGHFLKYNIDKMLEVKNNVAEMSSCLNIYIWNNRKWCQRRLSACKQSIVSIPDNAVENNLMFILIILSQRDEDVQIMFKETKTEVFFS